MKQAGLFLIVLLFVGCGGGEAEFTPLGEDAVILAFGDSLTRGTGAATDQAYPAVLQRLGGRKVINAGVPGELSAEGLKRLPGVLEKYHPALVILMHGGNDLLRKKPAEQIKKNLETMIELIRDQGAQVLLVAVPRPSLLLSAAPLYGEVAIASGVPLEDQALAEILQSRRSKSDAIHPNAKGYRQLAKAIYRYLEDHQAL